MRNKLVSSLAGAVFSFAASGLAVAADMAVKAPPPAPPAAYYNWTGFYIGANAGWGWGGSVEADPVTGGGVARIHAHGPTAGGEAGFNYQMGSVVLGAEGSLDWMNVNGVDVGCGFGTLTCHGHNTWFASVVGRAGYALDGLLIYAKGGVAWMHEEFNQVALTGATCAIACTGNATYTGSIFGGGLEYAIAPNWSIFLDYQNAQFPSQRITSSNSVGTVNVVNIVHHANAIRVGVNYKFGFGAP
jgi:outer membrane immunogenic protein